MTNNKYGLSLCYLHLTSRCWSAVRAKTSQDLVYLYGRSEKSSSECPPSILDQSCIFDKSEPPDNRAMVSAGAMGAAAPVNSG